MAPFWLKNLIKKDRPAGFGKNIFGRPAGFGKIFSVGRRDSENNFRAKKRSVAQIKDQVMTIKTHTESSKSELSSGTFDPVKG